MKQIFKQLLERCLNNQPTILVTIISDIGSAPRSSGAFMIVGETERLGGTIGGGMLEYNATMEAIECIKQQTGKLKKYHLSNEKSAELGMVCGGNVDLLFTYIGSTEDNKSLLKSILERINSNSPANLRLYYKNDKIEVTDKHTTSDEYFLQSLEIRNSVFIFGGGHLAQELVPLLSHLNFNCTIIDDRKEFSTKELFPTAKKVLTLDFDKLEGKFNIQPSDYIIAVTRGHTGDYQVLKHALKTPAYYIGAVGSKTKVAAINKKLKDDGYCKEEINRITSPIGIEIKSETPAEIAISIAAQLIEKRSTFKEP